MYGTSGKAGYKVQTAWGAAWATVDTLIPLVSESLVANYEGLRSEALIGSSAQNESEIGVVKVVGDLVFDLDYNNAHALLGYALGYGSGGVYYPADPFPSTKFFHLEIDKYTKRWRFQTCAVNSVEISGEASGTKPLQVTMNVVAYDCVTSDTAFPSLTLTTPNRVYFKHLSYARVGDLTGALEAGDNVRVNKFSVRVENSLQADLIDSGSGTVVAEPIRNDWRKTTLKLGLGRYLSAVDTVEALKVVGARVQAELDFVDGSEHVYIRCPQAKVTEGPGMNLSGPAALAGEFGFECYRNSANTEGMPTITEEVQITVT
jgi:hypothetical protein